MTTERKLLLLAAERMDNPSKEQRGCCSAIWNAAWDAKLRNSTVAEYRSETTALQHFDSLYRLSSTYSNGYWFGPPQYALKGEAERKTRQHRVYALLLAAESIE